jgi:hypothetical protein
MDPVTQGLLGASLAGSLSKKKQELQFLLEQLVDYFQILIF